MPFPTPGLTPLPEEEPLVAKSVAKRRNEFITVRHCARVALGQLGVPPVPILKGRDLLALGVPPGPEIGRVLQAVYERQLDGAVTTPAEAQAEARRVLGMAGKE